MYVSGGEGRDATSNVQFSSQRIRVNYFRSDPHRYVSEGAYRSEEVAARRVVLGVRCPLATSVKLKKTEAVLFSVGV